jgi:protein MpaA
MQARVVNGKLRWIRTRAGKIACATAAVSLLIGAAFAYAEITEPEDEPSAAPATTRQVTSPAPSGSPGQQERLGRVFGTSVQGRPMVVRTFGSGSLHVLVLGGIHGNEFGGVVAEQFAEYLSDYPEVVPASEQVDVVSEANPDGIAADTRLNARGVDLNRNFPSRNWQLVRRHGALVSGPSRASEPETRALLDLMATRRYGRIVSLHSSGGIVDYDGPGSRPIALRVSAAARTPVLQLPTYPGSMGSYVPERYGVPIITWELSSPVMSESALRGLLAGVTP